MRHNKDENAPQSVGSAGKRLSLSQSQSKHAPATRNTAMLTAIAYARKGAVPKANAAVTSEFTPSPEPAHMNELA